MDETRQYILEIFEKYKLRAGHYIDMNWLVLARSKANVIVQDNFDDTLQQMIEEDFFECKKGHGNTWFLTQKGEDVLFSYIKERNKKMNNDSSGISIQVNPVISSSFNQTQTNTQNLNVQLILQEQLDEETYKKLEEIIKSSIPQDEKNSKLKAFFKNLSSGVMSSILANLITNLPWG